MSNLIGNAMDWQAVGVGDSFTQNCQFLWKYTAVHMRLSPGYKGKDILPVYGYTLNMCDEHLQKVLNFTNTVHWLL